MLLIAGAGIAVLAEQLASVFRLPPDLKAVAARGMLADGIRFLQEALTPGPGNLQFGPIGCSKRLRAGPADDRPPQVFPSQPSMSTAGDVWRSQISRVGP